MNNDRDIKILILVILASMIFSSFMLCREQSKRIDNLENQVQEYTELIDMYFKG